MAKQDGPARRVARQAAVLAALATGTSKDGAARLAGVHPVLVRKWRRADRRFDAAIRAASAAGCARLEYAAWWAAVELAGVDPAARRGWPPGGQCRHMLAHGLAGRRGGEPM